VARAAPRTSPTRAARTATASGDACAGGWPPAEACTFPGRLAATDSEALPPGPSGPENGPWATSLGEPGEENHTSSALILLLLLTF
jgi:hypothetical protein